MGPFSGIKGIVLSLFLPVQVMPLQCIYNVTMLCQSVIIIRSNLQNSCMAKLSYLHVICGFISSVLSADQPRKLFIMRNTQLKSIQYIACHQSSSFIVYKINDDKFMGETSYLVLCRSGTLFVEVTAYSLILLAIIRILRDVSKMRMLLDGPMP